MAGTRKENLHPKISSLMAINNAKEFLKYIDMLAFFHIFLQEFLIQYSNFGNKCPKLGAGTPEDMLYSNLGVAT